MKNQLEQFSMPLLGINVIKRRELLAQIEELSQRSILFIHAPAGYGKTTVAVQWANNAVWFSLDKYYTQPINFYRGILLALNVKIPSGFTEAPLDIMLNMLERKKKWPDTVVIDDFHLLDDDSIIKALPLIRSRMPAHTAFLILSRNPPPEALQAELIKGTVKELANLQFTGKEIAEYFSKCGVPLSNSDAEALRAQTDGWAAALSAMLISGDTEYKGLTNRESLNHYFKYYVFGEYGDDIDILKKCSVCDTLDPELCADITGQADVWDILTTLSKKTGLVRFYNNNTVRFHALLQDFLQTELQIDKSIDKTELYRTAAFSYKNRSDWLYALELAVKSGDIGVMEEISRITSEEFCRQSVNMEKYISFVEDNFLSLPESILEQYPRLSGHCFMCLFYTRPLSEAFDWLDVRERISADNSRYYADNMSLAFIRAIDPRRSSWHVPKQFESISDSLPKTGKKIEVLSLTHNFPFFHKAQRDYTDIAPELPAFIAEITRTMAPILGSLFTPLKFLVEAGILYEQGKFQDAESVVLKTVGIADRLPPEIAFCCHILHTEILRVQGKNAGPESIGEKIGRLSLDMDYLLPNYRAYITTVQLSSGKTDAANTWLKHTEYKESFRLHRVYQHLTTARALMVAGKPAAADRFLERLLSFMREYRRNADLIESITLRSICKWRLGASNEAVKLITDSLVRAAELKLVTPIAKEGADILPILRKILGRLKRGYDTDILDKAYVNALYFKAQDISKKIPGMLAEKKAKPITLSPRQLEVLGYLEQGYSYQEIADEMGVTISASRYHINTLHQKFDVQTTRDLLDKARSAGFGNPQNSAT